MNSIKRVYRGFTLIELLVVIAIIGILAALVTANVLGARVRARDSQRKSDARQIQSALEMYRADQQTYPTTAQYNLIACGGALQAGAPAVTYMQKIPCDPTTNVKYSYSFNAASSTYYLRVCLENTSDTQKDSLTFNGLNQNNPNPPAACSASTVSYTITNP